MNYLSQALNAPALFQMKATSISMERVFEHALQEISREYLPGTIDYVKTVYPELWKRIVSAEETLSQAWLSGSAEDFNHALGGWRNLYLRTIELFRSMGTKLPFELDLSATHFGAQFGHRG